MRWLDDIPNSQDMNFNKVQKMVKDGEAWCAAVCGARVGNNLVTEQQDFNIWTVGIQSIPEKMLPVMLYSSPKIAIIVNTKEKLYVHVSLI